MNKKIKISLYPIIAVLLYIFCVIRLYYLENINMYSLFFGIIIFMYLFVKGAVLNNKKYQSVNVPLFIFLFLAFISSIINNSNIDGTILFILKVLNITLFVQYVFEIGKEKESSRIFFWVSIIMTMVTLIYSKNNPLAAWLNGLNYFIGNKFSVSYNSISSIIFFKYGYCGQKFNKHKHMNSIIVLLLIIFTFYICSLVKCSTGIVGTLFVTLILILFKFDKQKKMGKISFIMKPNFSIIFFIVSTISVMMLKKIIDIPIITHLIQNVFHKSLDLSGRLIIYDNISAYFNGHILFGYGYNMVYELFKNTMQIRSTSFAYDAQNALLEYFLYFGLVGCIAFLYFIKSCFKKLNTINIEEIGNKKYFILGFYLLVFLGIIEITINPLFYLFLAFLSCNPKVTLSEKENMK